MTLQFSDQRPPIPPIDLIRRVVPSFDAARRESEKQAFDEQAIPQLVGLERALSIVGRDFSGFGRILDFGCGPGRYIRHLGQLAETTEVHGADIDAQVIDWLRENVSYGRFEAIAPDPPTPYPDRHFDLILNHSVFTHLPEPMQDAWMDELHRISEPGGVLLLTIHSTPQWNRAAYDMGLVGDQVERMRTVLEQQGILFIRDDSFIGSTHPDFYHTTFHAPWYVFERWTRWFELAAYVPLGSDTQDLVVMRRRPDDEPGPRPIGHGTGAGAAAERATAPAPEPMFEVDFGRLEQVVARRPEPQTLLGRLKRRALARDLNRQEEVNRLLVGVLQENARELRMVRSGLYDHGQRVSAVADELREQLRESRASRDEP